jgi:hypothetical protein
MLAATPQASYDHDAYKLSFSRPRYRSSLGLRSLKIIIEQRDEDGNFIE